MSALFQSLPDGQPVIPDRLQRRIAALAEFVAIARTHIPRDGRTKAILYVPEPEGSTRLAQQLSQLAKGSALIGGRDVVDKKDIRVAQRAGMDSIPAARRQFLELIQTKKPKTTQWGLAPSTASYVAEDLRNLRLLEQVWSSEEGRGVPVLTAQAKRLLRQGGIRVKGGRAVNLKGAPRQRTDSLRLPQPFRMEHQADCTDL